MTVIVMSRTEIDRMSVLHDLADGRIRIAEASALMGLGRRQVFRLAKAFSQHGPQALVSRRRGRPSNRCYPTALRKAAIHATVLIEQYCLHHQAPRRPKTKQILPTARAFCFRTALRTCPFPSQRLF